MKQSGFDGKSGRLFFCGSSEIEPIVLEYPMQSRLKKQSLRVNITPFIKTPFTPCLYKAVFFLGLHNSH